MTGQLFEPFNGSARLVSEGARPNFEIWFSLTHGVLPILVDITSRNGVQDCVLLDNIVDPLLTEVCMPHGPGQADGTSQLGKVPAFDDLRHVRSLSLCSC